MRSTIIRGFLPWIVFFALAGGDPLGIRMGTMGGLICLFLFNRKSLKNGCMIDWSALGFFVLLPIIGFGFHHPLIIKYGVLWAYAALTLICWLSIIVKNPFALQYSKETASEIYWHHPVFLSVNYWITFIWGLMFLLSSLSVGLFAYGIGNKLWMLEILPTICLIIGIGFTIIFPDSYKTYATKSGGVSTIPGISEIAHTSLGNVSIAYRTLGKGPLLILLHDWYTNMHAWDTAFLEKLSHHFELLILDYPGTGYSTYENMPFNVETLAACLNEFITKTELNPAGIVGYGMGGYIAQYFSAQYRKKLNALVLLASKPSGINAIASNEEDLLAFKKALQSHITEKHLAFLTHYFSKFAAQRLFEKLQKIMSSAALEGEITQEMTEKENHLTKDWHDNTYIDQVIGDLPTLIVAGKQDAIIPAENAVKLSELFQPSTLTVYEDADHGLVYQYPLDIAENIINFYETHAR